jgi:hypothetical protein
MRLAKKEKAKLNQRIDSLELYGTDLIPGIVAPTGVASILKLKIHGKVQLRPMLCEGPGEKRWSPICRQQILFSGSHQNQCASGVARTVRGRSDQIISR